MKIRDNRLDYFQRYVVDASVANLFESMCMPDTPPQDRLVALLAYAPPGSAEWDAEDRVWFAHAIFSWLRVSKLRHEHHQRLYFVAECAKRYDFVIRLEMGAGMKYVLVPLHTITK